MSFFVVGEAYVTLKNHRGFSKEPHLILNSGIILEQNECFIVLDLIRRWATKEDELVETSSNDISKCLVFQLKVMTDNKILYLCYLYASEIELVPEKYFKRVS